MKKLDYRRIADSAIKSEHLYSDAKTAVLTSKYIAQRCKVGAISTVGGLEWVSINSEMGGILTGLSIPITPRDDLGGLGYFKGVVAGANDVRRTIIRLAGTDNGVPDGEGDEIYARLDREEPSGPIVAKFFSAGGNVFTFSSVVSIDIYPVIVTDLSKLSADALLDQAFYGVIDAGQSLTLATHLDGNGEKHGVPEIGDLGEFDGTTIITGASIPGALQDLETAVEGVADGYVPPDQVTSGEIAAGTEVGLRMFSPKDVTDSVITVTAIKRRERITLTSSNVTAKCAYLTHVPIGGVSVFFQGIKQTQGEEFSIATTNGSPSSVSKMKWGSDVVTPGMNELVAGDIIEVLYKAKVASAANILYRIDYDGNGGTGGIAPNGGGFIHNVFSTPATLTNSGNLVKTGKNFFGWNTLANGTGTDYATGANVSPMSDNMYLYAKWL